jgi:hypothetical protein
MTTPVRNDEWWEGVTAQKIIFIFFERGQSIMQATKVAAATSANKRSEPVKFAKRIGSTIYTVTVRFNPNATETLEQKLLRLIEREVTKSA